MKNPLVILAGATGDLGGRISSALAKQKTPTRALVRSGSEAKTVSRLKRLGVDVRKVNFEDSGALRDACQGGTCLVSALSGLRPVIVGTQTSLLEAALSAGVPRFIPSDFSIEIPKVPAGTNRNLDLRRDFHERLDRVPIQSTAIYNGAFMDMLLGQAPIVLPKLGRVLYWGDPDQRMAFTTKDDTAAFTARAATDEEAPRILRIAGDQVSARELAAIASKVYGKKIRLFRAGGVAGLERTIKIARALLPETGAIYPPWQGMQYLHNMFSGFGDLSPLDNERYGPQRFTRAEEVLRRT